MRQEWPAQSRKDPCLMLGIVDSRASKNPSGIGVDPLKTLKAMDGFY